MKLSANSRADPNRSRGLTPTAHIKPPPGVPQKEFERRILLTVIRYHIPPYAGGGPNSNTFVNNVIECAGGMMPDIPKANGQKYGK